MGVWLRGSESSRMTASSCTPTATPLQPQLRTVGLFCIETEGESFLSWVHQAGRKAGDRGHHEKGGLRESPNTNRLYCHMKTTSLFCGFILMVLLSGRRSRDYFEKTNGSREKHTENDIGEYHKKNVRTPVQSPCCEVD